MIWPDPDAETDSLANRIKGRVKVQFGTLATTDPGARQFYSVDKIVIHPDYCQVIMVLRLSYSYHMSRDQMNKQDLMMWLY